MFHHQPALILKKRSKIILLTGIITGVATLLVSLLLPMQYRADAQLYIISSSRYGADPFTIVKSAERIGENITKIMKTNDFYQKVISQPGYQLDLSEFQNIEERIKRKRWRKTINGSVVFGTGVLNVSAYHTNPEQAKAFAGAAIDTLVERGREYVGTDVSMKIVNHPVATRFPVRPNVVINTILGFLLGVLAMSLIVLRKKI